MVFSIVRTNARLPFITEPEHNRQVFRSIASGPARRHRDNQRRRYDVERRHAVRARSLDEGFRS